jgi:cell surface protein SprA
LISIEDSVVVVGIELEHPIQDSRALAVRYINELGDTIGDYQQFPESRDDTLFCELIKPRHPRPVPPFGHTWEMTLRNIYSICSCSIDNTNLEVAIADRTNRLDRTVPEGENVPYLRIFGLDRFNESGDPYPDNSIDLADGVIDLPRGLLTFPVLRPFDPPLDSIAAWTRYDTSFAVPDDYEGLENPDIYDDFLPPLQIQEKRKYDIIVRIPKDA